MLLDDAEPAEGRAASPHRDVPDRQLIRADRWLVALKRGSNITSLAKADGISEGCLSVRRNRHS